MNILIVEDFASSSFGGAERSMRAFSERLSQQHNVHLVYDRVGDYALDKADIYSSVTRISALPIGAQSVAQFTQATVRLVQLCRREKIDLLITHVVHAVTMLRLARALCSVSIGIYFKWICSTEFVGRQAQWGLRGLDFGASVSCFVATYWTKNGFPEAKMHVVPEGIEVGHQDLMTNWKASGGRDNYQERKFVLCFAGRIVEEKGLHTLLESVAALVKAGVAVECCIAGSFNPESPCSPGQYHAQLQRRVSELGLGDKIHFMGYIDPLPSLLKKMDAVIVPSICQDAQPLVLLQAMAEGIPVLASRVGGIPEVLSGNLSKWMFEPGNERELTDKILSLINLPGEESLQLASRLKEHIATEYTMDLSHRRLMTCMGIDYENDKN